MKRKLESVPNSSGRGKRPLSASIENPKRWDWSGNLVPRSRLTEEDVRRVVREEVELALSHWAEYLRRECRDNAKSMGKSDVRNLQLQLRNKLSLPIFTGKKLQGEGGARISVALIDANTGDVVTSGPESSIKLDVVVLEGDFNRDDEDNWAQEEFERYMVKERFGKGPLLTGDLLVTLKRGVGELGDLIFTDNSSWMRSKTFRIGLKVTSVYGGNTRIREAKTDPFPVREHRGESYQKHYPPAPDDDVWRLEKIAKDGKFHQKLSEAGIHRVEDFLLQLFTDAKTLREILGKSFVRKNWEMLVDHAKTCTTNRKLYLYFSDGMRKDGVAFNTDGQLIGLIKDRVYIATHRLSAQEKEHGCTIVEKALDNENDIMEFSGESFSPSLQKKSSSSLTPQICATPGGLEAPLANADLTAEGRKGVTALALPQARSSNFATATKPSVDKSICLSAQRPISADCLNVPSSPADSDVTAATLPVQSHSIN